MKKNLNKVIPRLVKIRRKGSQSNPYVVAGEDHDLVERAVDWWKDDKYSKVKRYKYFQWLGIEWFKLPYYESIEEAYLKPADDFVSLVGDLISQGIVCPLDDGSRVFEPGCNVGRNLLFLQDKYNCHVEGLDISAEAIRKAEEKVWNARSKYKFTVENALTGNFFDSIPDNAYDFVFTRWHLIHIPLSDAKKRYVESLKRIAKTVVLVEPVREGTHEVQLYQDGQYCLSWDDWESEYGLKEYKGSPDNAAREGHTGVFYATS